MRTATYAFVLIIAVIGSPAIAAPCPASFQAFWQRFKSDTAFQQRYLSPKVYESRLEDAVPDHRRVGSSVDRSKLRRPVVFSAKGYESKIRREPGAVWVVTVFKPDTDASTRYTFQKGDCWRLTRRDDDSL